MGKEVVLTFKCKLDPEADLSQYNEARNVAIAIVNGVEFTPEDNGNVATVLGISDIPDNKDSNSKTGDNAMLGLVLMALLASAAGAVALGRRRIFNR